MEMSIDNMSTKTIEKYLEQRKESKILTPKDLGTFSHEGFPKLMDALTEGIKRHHGGCTFDNWTYEVKLESGGTKLVIELCNSGSKEFIDGFVRVMNKDDDDECSICDDACDFKCGGW